MRPAAAGDGHSAPVRSLGCEWFQDTTVAAQVPDAPLFERTWKASHSMQYDYSVAPEYA